MKTRLLIMRPERPHETVEVNLPFDPGYDRLKAILTPLLDGADLEHVTVLTDFSGGTNYRRADMFVDEMGHMKMPPLQRNEAATLIYRRNTILQRGRLGNGADPETLPWIAGPAILFDRRVWF